MLSRPTPKKLILGLLLARDGKPLSVRDAIAACALFDLTENNTRVTLVRLSAEGLIQAAGRGLYVLGARAEGMARDVGGWREAPQRVLPWQGEWLAVLGQGRAARGRRARQMERALQLCGCRELEPGLMLRPANLSGGAAGLRQRLLGLGLPDDTLVATLRDLDSDRDRRARRLWDSERLERAYVGTSERLRAWLARYPELDIEEAARESYLLGGDAIRQLVFDPWLPADMVDTPSRDELFQAVLAVDAAGQSIWSAFYAREAAMPVGDSDLQGTDLFAR